MSCSIEERYGSKSDVTRYVADHHGLRKLPTRGEKGSWMNGVNRFIKVSTCSVIIMISKTVLKSMRDHLFFLS